MAKVKLGALPKAPSMTGTPKPGMLNLPKVATPKPVSIKMGSPIASPKKKAVEWEGKK